MHCARLAFVDIETTGLGPGRHRIAEIGVVTLDEGGVAEWGTLLDPGRRRVAFDHEFRAEPSFGNERGADTDNLPRFRDIAADLAARLDGRLFVAHNARFDHAFVNAEFERVGIAFAPQVLCTMMLSRKLYPQHDAHHLDALLERHRLAMEERHRALPDARALLGFWQALHREFPRRKINAAIDALLAAPLLPPHLDLGMIDALPERPGVFMFEGDDARALHIGRAGNLRRFVRRYFQIDRHCSRADKLSREVRAIRWEAADGVIDARLREIAWRNAAAMRSAASRRSAVSIRVDPAATPVVRLVSMADPLDHVDDMFGVFATERKAKNALRRIARREGIGESFLGLKARGAHTCSSTPQRMPEPPDEKHIAMASSGRAPRPEPSPGWPSSMPDGIGEPVPQAYNAAHDIADERRQHLVRFLTAIAPLRIQSWPYRGPIAIREGRKVHVFDMWAYLGSVRSASDIAALSTTRRGGFDADVFALLQQVLPRLPARSLRVLRRDAGKVAGQSGR